MKVTVLITCTSLLLSSLPGDCLDDCVSDRHSWQSGQPAPKTKQPVIIDTDIGSFIDDSFAVALAVQSPNDLDIKLIVTCTDNTTARAKVVAKLMKMLGRDDVPIGIGLSNSNKTHQSLIGWGAEEDLTKYRGGVFEDGIAKMAEVIGNSTEVVNIIAIGPMTNFPSLVDKYPNVVKNARIRAMAGSIHVGYHGSPTPAAEYNVYMCPWCMEKLLTAGWVDVAITPLDTCGNVVMTAEQVDKMLEGDSGASAALASTLTYFCIQEYQYCHLNEQTPILYDVVGTLIAVPEAGMLYMNYSVLNLKVTDTGYTVIDKTAGTPTSVALTWKEHCEEVFTELLTLMYSGSGL